MIRRWAYIGLAIFVVGIVMLSVGLYGTLHGLHTVGPFTQRSAGEFVSPELNFTSQATVTILHPPSGMGLVAAANLSEVNASTFSTYAIPPTTASGGTYGYLLNAGSYYVVYFGSTSPSGASVDYLYLSEVTGYGALTIVGLGLAVGGGIFGLIGVFKKPKRGTVPPPPGTFRPS